MTSIAAPAATTTTWAIDAAHSHVEFAVKHLMISTVKGRFGDVQGTVTADDTTFRDAVVDIRIGVASIDTRQADRDTHLRSADFFEADKFPTMTFKSTRVEPQKDDTLRVVGQLTIRGVSKEVVLDGHAGGPRPRPVGRRPRRLQRHGEDQPPRFRADVEPGARGGRLRRRRRDQDRHRRRTGQRLTGT